MEIVTKEQYWIDILNDNSKFGQITTEDTSFNLRANDVWKVVENTLLDTEDEEEVMNWERITQLDSGELTIFQRKVNILYVLSTKSYVPISLIEEIATKTSGKDVEIFYDKEQGKLVVHTDRAEGDTVEITNSIINKVLPESVEMERYNHNLEISWDKINKYAACTTGAEMLAVNADCKNDLTSDGEWIYPLAELTKGANALKGSPITKFAIDLPKLTDWGEMLGGCPKLVEIRCNLPKCIAFGNGVRNSSKLEIFDGYMQKVTDATNAFNGCSLRVFTSPLPALIAGSSMFHNCALEKEYAINILSSLQTATSATSAWNWKITIGIHIDNQNNEEVLAAISDATAKGWTVTTQWNGTATTSTYSLRPTQSQPIYAKYEADELGTYIDDNNVRYSVNWGHMISSPDGKSPEELGYQEFASLEEALTTWGLTEIMETPEQES
jgi:hypothetical protein